MAAKMQADEATATNAKHSILKKQPRNDTDVGPPLHTQFATSVDLGVESESVNVIDDITVVGFRRNRIRQLLIWLCYILTLGALRLVFFWKPDWYLACTHDECAMRHAEKVRVSDAYQQCFVHHVRMCTRSGTQVRLVAPKKKKRPPSVSYRSNSHTQQNDETRLPSVQFADHVTISGENEAVRTVSIAGGRRSTDRERTPLRSAIIASTSHSETDTDAAAAGGSQSGTARADLSEDTALTKHDYLAKKLAKRRHSYDDTDGNESESDDSESEADSSESDAQTDADDELMRYFIDREVKYVYDTATRRFVQVIGLDDDPELRCSSFHSFSMRSGLSEKESQRRLVLYGHNSIDVAVTPILKLVVTELLHPFYVFQIFSVILWMTDEYVAFACAIIVMSVVSLSFATYQTRVMQLSLRKMVDSNFELMVLRQRSWFRDASTPHFRGPPGSSMYYAGATASRVADSNRRERNMSIGSASATASLSQFSQSVRSVASSGRRSMKAVLAASYNDAADGTIPLALPAATPIHDLDSDADGVDPSPSRNAFDMHRSELSARTGNELARGMSPRATGRFGAVGILDTSITPALAKPHHAGSVISEASFGTSLLQSGMAGTHDIPGTYFRPLDSTLLVPGDVIEIPRSGCVMPCDAVLISGHCIVNESTLTGESVPVTKTPIAATDSDQFMMAAHGRHTLFCGTSIIQTRYFESKRVLAIVIRSGFATAKGELVRGIMFPKPVDFKFIRQSFQFILFMAVLAFMGFIYTLYIMISVGSSAGLVVRRALDLFTIVVPPSLPAAMTVGITFAQTRLKAEKVYCTSPNSLNMTGAIDTVCFDKTGTLTEDGLDLNGVLPLRAETKNAPNFGTLVENIQELAPRSPLLEALATCHSLTLLDSRLLGDPLDIKMFEALDWELEEHGEDTNKYEKLIPTVVRPRRTSQHARAVSTTSSRPESVKRTDSENETSNEEIDPLDSGEGETYEIGILRQFTFVPALQRMSVIVRVLGESGFKLYAKGAPEMIAKLCKPETMPSDFQQTLTSFTRKGYRVLALAYRPLRGVNYARVQKQPREKFECELQFLGLLVMENRLKPATTGVIQRLLDAHIRSVMITGDNLLTALSVARECAMIAPHERIVIINATDSQSNANPNMDTEVENNGNVDVRFTGEDGSLLLQSNDPRYYEQAAANEMVTSVLAMARGQGAPTRVHFALSGESWRALIEGRQALLDALLERITVFARMLPEQKVQVVEAFEAHKHFVAMCGDGANDCGALKAAHAGISLSEAEASVAAPFTSRTPTIECVPTVISEGRAALTTSFSMFKFICSYSLTQFVSVLILYYELVNLGDIQFLWIDLFVILSLSVTSARTRASRVLVRSRPPMTLVSLINISSMLAHLLTVAVTQTVAYLFASVQPWYLTPAASGFEPFDKQPCDINTVLFSVSAFQYVMSGFVFTTGPPHRLPIYRNWMFCLNLVVLIAITLCILFLTDAAPWLAAIFDLESLPSMTFRFDLLLIVIANWLVAWGIEKFYFDSRFARQCCTFNTCRESHTNAGSYNLDIEFSDDSIKSAHTGGSCNDLDRARRGTGSSETHTSAFASAYSIANTANGAADVTYQNQANMSQSAIGEQSQITMLTDVSSTPTSPPTVTAKLAGTEKQVQVQVPSLSASTEFADSAVSVGDKLKSTSVSHSPSDVKASLLEDASENTTYF